MARSFPANPRDRSQQGAGAEARDPWEDAAAALYPRRSRALSEPWGTGARSSREPPITDTWGAGVSTEALVTDNWRPRASRLATVTDGWGTMASTEATITDTWGVGASTEALLTNFWGLRASRASRQTPVTDSWGGRASRVAPVTDGWGTMASTEAPVTYNWGPDPAAAGDNWGRSVPEGSRFTVPPPSESEILMNITVSNARSFLHCGVCSLPLKPAIFQCDAGHAVCSACRNELLGRGLGRTCNVCGGPGYRRCRFMDGLVESLRVACPNAAHGCDATPAYYDLRAHRAACAHAPRTPCPVRGCGFVAPMAELLGHFTDVHGWPLTTEEHVGRSFDVDLQGGFNLVAAADRDGSGSNQQHLLLLNVVRQPFGRTISAACIHPQPAAVGSWEAELTKTVELELCYSASRHYQESEFSVPFVDLADGLPNELAQFVVPKSVHPDDDAPILVTAFLTIK